MRSRSAKPFSSADMLSEDGSAAALAHASRRALKVTISVSSTNAFKKNQVSALVYLLKKVTAMRTFENVRQSLHLQRGLLRMCALSTRTFENVCPLKRGLLRMCASLQTQLLHSLKQHHSAVQRKRAHPCSCGLGAGSDKRSKGDFVRLYTIFRHVV